MMTIRLSEELEAYLRDQVASGQFSSENQAITAAVRLLKGRQDEEAAGRASTPHDVNRRLLASGSIHRLPDPAEDLDDRDDPPIPVSGELVSETIIRERR